MTRTGNLLRVVWVSSAAALLAALLGCARVAGLPEVPASLTAADAGLDGLDTAAREARRLAEPRVEQEPARRTPTYDDPVESARAAQDRIRHGDSSGGLRALADVVTAAPSDSVIANAFRMEVYRAKRAFFEAAKMRGERMPVLPESLRDEPLATLRRAATAAPGREIGVQIALAHVDEMMLMPALEIRAPASIASVRAFRAVLDSDPFYVPALVGRGLNHLNRPRNLVWPEHPPPPAGAASRDLSLAVAVGAKVGGASSRVRGMLALLLGDAYAHEGSAALARSWWTLAAELTDDAAVQRELRVRAAWPEREMPDRLEARLAERMAEVNEPVSDLSFLWDDSARGPW